MGGAVARKPRLIGEASLMLAAWPVLWASAYIAETWLVVADVARRYFNSPVNP